jgi:hypothetical protein
MALSVAPRRRDASRARILALAQTHVRTLSDLTESTKPLGRTREVSPRSPIEENATSPPGEPAPARAEALAQASELSAAAPAAVVEAAPASTPPQAAARKLTEDGKGSPVPIRNSGGGGSDGTVLSPISESRLLRRRSSNSRTPPSTVSRLKPLAVSASAQSLTSSETSVSSQASEDAQ